MPQGRIPRSIHYVMKLHMSWVVVALLKQQVYLTQRDSPRLRTDNQSGCNDMPSNGAKPDKHWVRGLCANVNVKISSSFQALLPILLRIHEHMLYMSLLTAIVSMRNHFEPHLFDTAQNHIIS